MSLEIRWIEDLIAIEQTGLISRAASLRCVSQPAFSRRIQQLEQQLGFQVLQRNAKEVEFTESGLVLVNSAKHIAQQLKDTIALLNNMQQENNLSIRFAVAHSLTSHFFTRFLQFFPSNINNFKLEMQAINVFEGMQRLKNGDSDFILCYADHSLLDHLSNDLFRYIRLGTTDLVPVCTVDENLQCKFDIHQKFPLISYSPQAYLQQLVSEILTTNKLKYQLLYETDNANNVKDLVMQGRGIAWLPRLTIEQELNSHQLKICDQQLIKTDQDIYLMKLNLEQRESIEQIWRYVYEQNLDDIT